MNAQRRRNSCIALHIFSLGARGGWGGRRHVPAVLPVVMTQYPFYRRLGGPVWTCAKNIAPTRILSPDRLARNESLYRPSYPGLYYIITVDGAGPSGRAV